MEEIAVNTQEGSQTRRPPKRKCHSNKFCEVRVRNGGMNDYGCGTERRRLPTACDRLGGTLRHAGVERSHAFDARPHTIARFDPGSFRTARRDQVAGM